MQADVNQECEPGTNLLEQLLADRPGDGIEWNDIDRRAGVARVDVGQRIEEPGDLADGHRPQLDQSPAADLDRPRTRVKPGTRALGASHAAHERLELSADRATGGSAVLRQELVSDTHPFLGVGPDLIPSSSSDGRSAGRRCHRATRGALFRQDFAMVP